MLYDFPCARVRTHDLLCNQPYFLHPRLMWSDTPPQNKTNGFVVFPMYDCIYSSHSLLCNIASIFVRYSDFLISAKDTQRDEVSHGTVKGDWQSFASKMV